MRDCNEDQKWTLWCLTCLQFGFLFPTSLWGRYYSNSSCLWVSLEQVQSTNLWALQHFHKHPLAFTACLESLVCTRHQDWLCDVVRKDTLHFFPVAECPKGWLTLFHFASGRGAGLPLSICPLYGEVAENLVPLQSESIRQLHSCWLTCPITRVKVMHFCRASCA